VTRDECGDPVIIGRFGRIYSQDRKLAVCLGFSRKVREKLHPTAHRKLELLSRCNNRDPQTYLEGEDECIIVTPPDKVPFLKAAIKLLGIPRKRGQDDKRSGRGGPGCKRHARAVSETDLARVFAAGRSGIQRSASRTC